MNNHLSSLIHNLVLVLIILQFMLLFLWWIKSKSHWQWKLFPWYFYWFMYGLWYFWPSHVAWQIGILRYQGVTYKWFSSYLSNTSQFVSLGTIDSDSKQILCEVPQNSILGPLLFLMYVNDLHKCTSVLAFNLFVDDTNIFLQDKNLHSLEFKLNEELHKVNQWLQLNRLSFVVFCPPQRKPQSISLKFQTGPWSNCHMSNT